MIISCDKVIKVNDIYSKPMHHMDNMNLNKQHRLESWFLFQIVRKLKQLVV